MLLKEIFLRENTTQTSFILDLSEPSRSNALAAFKKLGEDQRHGDPEKLGGASLRNKGIHASGLYAGLTEHVGDITHRMTEEFDRMLGLYGNVREKVTLGIRRIEENDIPRQVKANYEFNIDPERDEDALKYKSKSVKYHGTYDEWLKWWKDAGKLYGDAHAKLVVWNEAQWHAREAAVAIGYMKFGLALAHLKELKKYLNSKEEWTQYAGQVTIGSDNNPIPYKSNMNESLMESAVGQTVTLNDLYETHELYDHSESIGRFVDNYGDSVTKEKFTVKEMLPNEAMKLETDKDNTTIFQAYKKFATRAQKKIVADKKKKFDESRIVVIDGTTVIDGNHHIIAAIELNKPFLHINLSD